jgi:hypothetical protein
MNIKGYGYSVWYVPDRWKDIQISHNIRHIPHVTVSTGKSLRVAKRLVQTIPTAADIQLYGACVEFPSMYDINPLKAIGWYATFLEPCPLAIPSPHMSAAYFVGDALPEKEIMAPTDVLVCSKCVADTRSNDPMEWYLC